MIFKSGKQKEHEQDMEKPIQELEKQEQKHKLDEEKRQERENTCWSVYFISVTLGITAFPSFSSIVFLLLL